MLQQISFIDVHAAKSLQQLLDYEDEAFIYCAYRTLLARDPDPTGLSYYLRRIRAGENKMQIVKDLSSSPEGRKVDSKVQGLEAGILRQKISRLFSKNSLSQEKINVGAAAAESILPAADADFTASKAVRIIKSSNLATSFRTQPTDKEPTLWVDLTTALEWTGGVVGIIRAELEIACGLNKVANNVKFSMQIENGFVEIKKEQLQWLLTAENVADAYMNFFGRYKQKSGNEQTNRNSAQNYITVEVPETRKLHFPFKPNDTVIAVGWMDSKKEDFFPKVKELCPGLKLGYLIYDIIMLHKDTTHFYDVVGSDRFKNYLKWISINCDFTLFGGETAKKDTQALQAEMGWPTPIGAAVKFGTDIMKSVNPSEEKSILKDLGVNGPFIITVGSIEPRKNHDTLYRAYVLALQKEPKNLPQLIICGKPMWRADDLVDTIERDPRLKGKVLRLSPTDTQLAALYKHCLFTVLPSLYEGWSLTLPESLGQGKFCLCTDTPPLREIGQDLVDYAPGWDVNKWAEKIIHYSLDKALLASYEQKISERWPKTRWKDTAVMIRDAVSDLTSQLPTKNEKKRQQLEWEKPVIWMDITLTFLYKHDGISGIIRSELNFARYLKSINPNTRFFAYYDNYFFEVLPEYLIWLFDESDLASSYKMFQAYWENHETAGTGYRNPFRVTNGPVVGHPAYLEQFPENSVVLFVGIDADQNGKQHRTKDVLNLVSNERGVMTAQLIYDFTPILYPHFHAKQTCDGFYPFVKHVSQNFDHLIYGGRTAQRDGIEIQKSNDWKIPTSDFIEFGSNFEKPVLGDAQSVEKRDLEILKSLGIKKQFIMTVGTIEPRKNHEMLYKAYVTLLNKYDEDNIPQMLFIGRQGWKTADFLATFAADKRVQGKILTLTPTDEELDVLYRKCEFTMLPSFYEGWSLTLPESLSYGKFCLTSDVDPLRETGRDLVEYINPLDTFSWAERIYYYATHREELKAKESHIKKNWVPKSWRESTLMLRDALYAAHQHRFKENTSAEALVKNKQ